MAQKRYKIILTDDHLYVSESLKLYIEEHHSDRLEVLSTPQNGRAAIADVKKFKPDLIVLDIQMPGMDGISAIHEIKRDHPSIIVLVFSAFDDRAHILDAIRTGADDYLFKKNSTPPAVADHILRALAKSLPSQDELHTQLFQAIRYSSGDSAHHGLPELTGTEMEILKLAAYKGASAKDTIEELGGKLSTRTVNTHWQHIYNKFGVTSQAQAVCMAVKLGLISADPVEPTRE
ncbi:MAG: response regulator transcription factor [Elusimicrobia bacterium]|nr:response regulator transcription factor [Elusimicrobiota bacterium]